MQNIPRLTPSSADGNWVYGLVQIASLRIPAARAGFYALVRFPILFSVLESASTVSRVCARTHIPTALSLPSCPSGIF